MFAWCSSFREVPLNLIRPFCTYLLNRYLGCYLLNKQLDIEQLSLDIFAGKGSLKDVNLDVKCINEALADIIAPVQLFDGFIHEISLHVPWSRLVEDCCLLEVNGLELTFKASSVYQHCSQGNSVLDSFMASMTSSLDLARSFVEEHNEKYKDQCAKEDFVQFDMVAPLVKLIDAVLSRMRLNVNNIIVRLEHYSDDRGAALEVRVEKLEFYDSSLDVVNGSLVSGLSLTSDHERTVSKIVKLSTLQLYTDWFVPCISLKTAHDVRRTSAQLHQESLSSTGKLGSSSFYYSCTSQSQTDCWSSGADETHSLSTAERDGSFSDPHLFASLNTNPLTVKFQISRSQGVQTIDVSGSFGSAYVLLSPQRLKILLQLMQLIFKPGALDARATPRCGPMNDSDFEKVENELKLKINTEFGHSSDGGNWVGSDKFYAFPSEQAESNACSNGDFLPAYPPLTCSLTSTTTRVKLIFSSIWLCVGYEEFPDARKKNNSASLLSSDLIEQFFKLSSEVVFNCVSSLTALRSQCDAAFPLDHLRLIGGPAIVDMNFGNRSGSGLSDARLTNFRLSFRNCELVECLTGAEPCNRYTELVVFDQAVAKLTEQPNVLLKMTLHDAEWFTTLEMNPCRVEADVSLLHRLQPVLRVVRPFCASLNFASVTFDSPEGDLHLKADLFDALETEQSYAYSSAKVKLCCTLVDLDIRMPLARLSANGASAQHCAKPVHRERVRLKLCNLLISPSVDGTSYTPLNVWNISFTSAYAQLYDHQGVCTNLCRASSVDKLCAISIGQKYATDTCSTIDSSVYDNDELKNSRSIWEATLNPQEKDGCFNPFSKTSVAYEGEPLLIVGNCNELAEFKKATVCRCKLNVVCNLGLLRVFVPNKAIYELLYNRLFVEFSLWYSTWLTTIDNLSTQCSPNFYELHAKLADNLQESPENGALSKDFHWSLLLVVDQFVHALSLLSEVDERCTVAKCEGTNLEFYAVLCSSQRDDQAMLFYATLDKLAVSTCQATGQQVDGFETNFDSEQFGNCSTMSTLLAVTSGSMTISPKGGSSLSLSGELKMRSRGDHSDRHLLISFGLRDLTIYASAPLDLYNMLQEFRDFFNLQTYPIEGYAPPSLSSEVHVHVWNISLECCPRPSVARLLINIGSADMATLFTIDMAVFRLHIIMEDWTVFLAPVIEDTQRRACLKDFVCVMKMGFFDFVVTFRIHPVKSESQFELHARNDTLHIYNCSDSAALLAALLSGWMEVDDGRSCAMEKSLQHNSSVSSALIESAIEEEEEEQEEMTAAQGLREGDLRCRNESQSSNVSVRSDDSFMLLENIPGSGISSPGGQPVVRLLDSEPIHLESSHFVRKTGRMEQLIALPPGYPSPVAQYYFQNFSIAWHIFGGHDFPLADNCSGSSIPGGCFYSDAGTKFATGDGFNRDNRLSIEFCLHKVSFFHQHFGENFAVSSRQVISVQDFEIVDRLPVSKVNKLLCSSERVQGSTRQSSTPMLCLRCVHLAPNSGQSAQAPPECRVKLSIVPLKLSVDQDTYEFLQSYFHQVQRTILLITGQKSPPPASEQSPGQEASSGEQRSKTRAEAAQQVVTSRRPIFFRQFTVSPSIDLKLEYFGKRIDIDYGALQGLLIGLSRLHCTELLLKELDNRHGLLGLEKVILYALNEWLLDIRQNQLMNIVGSVGPLHNLSEIAQGVRDLFLLPLDELRRGDGRVMRGLHRGAHSFGITTTAAILELTQKFFQTIHTIAEFAFDVIGPDESSVGRYLLPAANQPSDFREGLAMACRTVRSGFEESSTTRAERIVRSRWSVGELLRQATPCVFKPVLVASQATHQILGGIKSHFKTEE